MAGLPHPPHTGFNDFRSQLNGLLATLQKLPVGEKQTALDLLKVTVSHQLEDSAHSKTKLNFSEPEKYCYQARSNSCLVQEGESHDSEREFEHQPNEASAAHEVEENACISQQAPHHEVQPQHTHLKHSLTENVSFSILHLSEADCLESALDETAAKNISKSSSQKDFSSEKVQVSCGIKQSIRGSDICPQIKIDTEGLQSTQESYCSKEGSCGTRKDGDCLEDDALVHVANKCQKNIPHKRALFSLHSTLKIESESGDQHCACLESLGKYDEALHVSEQGRFLDNPHESPTVPLLSQSEQQLTLIASQEFCETSQEAAELGTILHSQDPDRGLQSLEEQTEHSSQEYGCTEPLMHLRIINEKQDRDEGKVESCSKSDTFDENSCNSLNLTHFHPISDRDNIYSEENSYLLPYLERENYDKIEYKIENITRKSNQDSLERSLEASYSSDNFLDCSRRTEACEELEQDRAPVDLSSTSSSIQSVKLDGCIMTLEESHVSPHQSRESVVFSSDAGDAWDHSKLKARHPEHRKGRQHKKSSLETKRQRPPKNNESATPLKHDGSVEDTDSCELILDDNAFGENLTTNKATSETLIMDAAASHVESDNQCHGFEASLPGSVGSQNLDIAKCSDREQVAVTLEGESESPGNLASDKAEGMEARDNLLSSNLLPVSCRSCKKELPDISLFPVHQRQCEGHHTCTICLAKFVHKVTYSRHMEGHKRNVCSKCSQSFCSHKKLKDHMKSEHNFDLLSKTHPCPMCSRNFLKRSSLYYHLKVVHAAENEHVCQKCGLFCKGSETFSLHMADHYKATKFHCHICSASFKRRQQYDDHLKYHKKNRCELCGQPFTTKRELVRHCRLEHNTLPQNVTLDREYKCDKCDRVFNRPSLLRHHLQLHRGVKLECRLCNKQFSHKRGLRKHMNSVVHEHTLLTNNLQKDHAYDVKQNFTFVCEYCGLKLPTKHMLSRHSRLAHKVGITWSCPHCDYTTKRNHTLKRHMELHLESRNFMCEICGSSFHALATLKDHYNFVHSDERNYKCNECNKTFKNKSSLARHSRTHSDDRPYQCHCGTSYKRLSHLKRHTSSAHKEVMKSRAVKKFKRSEDMEANLDDPEVDQNQNHPAEFSDGEELEFVSVPNSALSPVIQTDSSVKGAPDILLPTQESIILMGENSNSEQGHLITVGDSQIIQLIPSTFQFPQENSFQTVSLVSTDDLQAIPLPTSSYSQEGPSGPVVVESFSLSQSSEAMVMVPASHHIGDADTIPATLRTLEGEPLTESGRMGRESANRGVKQEITLPTLNSHTELPVSPSLDTYDYSGAAASPQTTSLLPALPPAHYITHAHSHNTSQDILQPNLICSDFVLPVDGNR